MAVLGYLPKLKRGLGLAFGALFVHDFSIKNVPYLIPNLSVGKVLRQYLFPLSKYQTECVIRFLFRQLMTS